jgi:hypothetical protein
MPKYHPMRDNTPVVIIDGTDEYEKELKKLRKKYRSIETDLEPLISKLEAGETPGDKISATNIRSIKLE